MSQLHSPRMCSNMSTCVAVHNAFGHIVCIAGCCMWTLLTNSTVCIGMQLTLQSLGILMCIAMHSHVAHLSVTIFMCIYIHMRMCVHHLHIYRVFIHRVSSKPWLGHHRAIAHIRFFLGSSMFPPVPTRRFAKACAQEFLRYYGLAVLNLIGDIIL